MTYDVFKAEAPSPKYPFAQMQPGDAFDVPRGSLTLARVQSAVSASARQYAKRNDPEMKFSTNRQDAETIRCRRVK